MSRWLITGGTGFVGSYLVKKLFAQGEDVIVLDNLSNSDGSLLEPIKDSISLIKGDIRFKSDVLCAMTGVDKVVHLAAIGSVRYCQKEPFLATEVNTLGTLQILESAKKLGISRVVFISSSTVYGHQAQLPYTEAMDPHPISVYGISKLSAELLTQAYHRISELDVINIRLFGVYGPGQKYNINAPRLIPHCIEASIQNRPVIITGNGSQTRDFIFVDDAVEGIISAGQKIDIKNETINLASGQRHSALDLIQMIEEIRGKRIKITFEPRKEEEMWDTWADISKAQKLLGFSPKYSLTEGLHKTIQWFEVASQEN